MKRPDDARGRFLARGTHEERLDIVHEFLNQFPGDIASKIRFESGEDDIGGYTAVIYPLGFLPTERSGNGASPN